jgi:hypothetical protein
MLFQPGQDQTVYNLDVAYGIVKERLRGIDIPTQCARSGAIPQLNGSVLLPYLNLDYRLDPYLATAITDGQPVSLRTTILLFHYFIHARGTPATGRQITYRDLPGGLVYYPTFIKRTIKPLTDTFGMDPTLLKKAGELLCAESGPTGDASLVVEAFPRVRVTLILWQGDDELKPEVSILFDANISDYLEPEDVTVVCETITWRLINHARGQQDHHRAHY